MIHRFDAFVTGITTCYKYIQRIKAMEMTELGLKGTHVMCLFYLNLNPEGLTAAQLCALCDEDKAAISRTVAELTSRGYIVTSDPQKYRARLCLTDAGAGIAVRMNDLIEQWVCTGGDGLSESERETFYRSLGVIANNLRGHFPKK